MRVILPGRVSTCLVPTKALRVGAKVRGLGGGCSEFLEMGLVRCIRSFGVSVRVVWAVVVIVFYCPSGGWVFLGDFYAVDGVCAGFVVVGVPYAAVTVLCVAVDGGH